ncbi:MAG TPA: aminotransferase class III-fold pyridoxal phosphate-dependent enzyme [Rhizomicrobium sp.]|jgi:beta-alanine--pyruvate transaminase|nr:aminotransferase class III-fold pyridoxal phosphate-dependent enzyme [Rhizomicrobium sp.]
MNPGAKAQRSALPPRNDLSALWLPFTANRAFRRAPRMLARAEGMYFYDESGRALLDTCSGLWCVNAGHGRKEITEAIREAAGTLDYAPTFQFGHPAAFDVAARLAALAPPGLGHVFFVSSGSEAVDAALKIARGYFHSIGQGTRFRLIGRERGYHGATFAGISVGGIGNNRRSFGPLLPGTDDHLPLPYARDRMAFTRGEPEGGAEFAEALVQKIVTHGAETLAAVIVEPMAGSAGVFAAPSNYLQRLRAICDAHGILLIFDEVITAFGRLGQAFAAERYAVTPDMIVFAKGVTNGAVPMGGVVVSGKLYDAFMQGPESGIELFHGHTYSAHPLACAAARASLDVYCDAGLFQRAQKMAPLFQEAVHSLRDAPHVVDIRNVGLAAGIDLAPDLSSPGRKGYEVLTRAFRDENLVLRVSGDTIALAPALIVSEAEIARMVAGVRTTLERLD